MEAKEKSSSPAATAKGTAPSNYKYFSSLPPIFQVSDLQTKDVGTYKELEEWCKTNQLADGLGWLP